MRKPYANATNTGADAVVLGIRRGQTVTLRCFICDWGYTVPKDAAEESGIEHANEHPETHA